MTGLNDILLPYFRELLEQHQRVENRVICRFLRTFHGEFDCWPYAVAVASLGRQGHDIQVIPLLKCEAEGNVFPPQAYAVYHTDRANTHKDTEEKLREFILTTLGCPIAELAGGDRFKREDRSSVYVLLSDHGHRNLVDSHFAGRRVGVDIITGHYVQLRPDDTVYPVFE